MEREKEIIEAGIDYTMSVRPMCIGGLAFEDEIRQMNRNKSFEEGAKWADSHPLKVYVVVRCEEHDDYVEKVFVDKTKANEYCNKFEGNPNEYGRYYEEMEVTL